MTHTDGEPRLTRQQAIIDALAYLGRVWPKKFSAHLLDVNLELFDEGMASVRIDCILPAAKQWVQEQKFPPTPSELGTYARKVEQVRYPRVGAENTSPTRRDPDLQAALDDLHAKAARMDRICLWLVKKVGSLEAVGEVMAIAWQRCQTDEDRARLRRDGITKDECLLALTEWQHSRQPQTPEDDGGSQYAP